MIKDEIKAGLNKAMKEKKKEEVSTLRLILAAIKDEEIAVRTAGAGQDELPDEALIKLLDGMIKQRRQSIEMFAQGGRQELVEKEKEEIRTIQKFLPRQLTAKEVEEAVSLCVAQSKATSLKDMRLVMDCLKEKYAGQLDMGKAASLVKGCLG